MFKFRYIQIEILLRRIKLEILIYSTVVKLFQLNMITPNNGIVYGNINTPLEYFNGVLIFKYLKIEIKH